MASATHQLLLAASSAAGTWTTLIVADGNGVITGGVTITVSSSTGGARSASVRSAGKCYFECVCTTIGNGSTGAGLTATGVSSSIITTSVVDCLAIYKSGNIWIDGANTGTSLGAFTNGQLLCFAIDWDNDKIWIRLGAAGNWNASAPADPAANVGGLSITGLADGRPAGYCNAPTDAMTFNFGASAFTGTPPSGFVPGWPL